MQESGIEQCLYLKEVLYEDVASDDVLYLCLLCRDNWISIADTCSDDDSICFKFIEAPGGQDGFHGFTNVFDGNPYASLNC